MEAPRSPPSLATSIDLSAAINAAVTAAHIGAAVLQSYAHHRTDLLIDRQGRKALVAQAAREAQAAIIQELQARAPQFGIVAENTGGRAQPPATWYISPLDGVTNFLHDIPHYAVTIGLIAHAGTAPSASPALSADTPVLGIVYDPCREELFTGLYGVGAWLNGHRIACSRTLTLDEAVIATGFAARADAFDPSYIPMLQEAMRGARSIRRLGASALGLAWTACGRLDGYWEMGLAPWNVAAGTLILREAGGLCNDIHTVDAWPIGGCVVAGNPEIGHALHAMLAPHLNPHPQ